jgi:predicted AAA+ superfamily ATPase
MSKICETCLKFVKNYFLFKYVSQSFTFVVDVFMKLVKYFLLFKFVSICFSFVKKGTKSFTNLKAQYVVDSTPIHTIACKKEFSRL